MAPPSTAERIRHAYARFNAAGQIDWSLLDPAIRHDHSEGLFLDGTFYGREGVAAALAEVESDWDDLRYEVEDCIDLGGRWLVLLRLHARVRGSDAELDAQIAHLWEFRDGRAVRWDEYGDRKSALRAVGGIGPLDPTVIH